MTCNENSGFIAPEALDALNRLVVCYQESGKVLPLDAYAFASLLSIDGVEIPEIVNILNNLQGLITAEILRAAGNALLDNTADAVGPSPAPVVAAMYFVLANSLEGHGSIPTE